MRYTRYTAALKALVAGGVGGIATSSISSRWATHTAHSFVRGNWRNTTEVLAHAAGKVVPRPRLDAAISWASPACRCRRSAACGTSTQQKNAQAGAADRCLDCSVEAECPYSAARFYLGRLRAGQHGWPLDVITSEINERAVIAALREGPYGRCVYACDNDVVNHQVVSAIRFADDSSASFTMTAFTRARDRETRIFGTRGEILGDGRTIEVFDFLTNQTERIEVDPAADGSILSGHGGGDQGVFESFVAALAQNDPAKFFPAQPRRSRPT